MLPRIAFVGVGWIGRDRLAAVARSGRAEIVGIADPSAATREAAAELAPTAAALSSLEEALQLAPDGVVIATPSALHAEQAIAAFRAGASVFCQKPVGRTASEVAAVVGAARAADRLLAVDFSYRHTEGMRRIRELVQGGEIGDPFGADLVFHNAYGPDKPWFYDPRLSGGGCVMDLGVHLVDLALWTLGSSGVSRVDSHLISGGRPLHDRTVQVEDYAIAHLELNGGEVVRIACSWNLNAGRDAVIEATFYGTGGGASLRNVNGSYYDFVAERFDGTASSGLAHPPDAWGGRAIVEWVERLARGDRFDAASEEPIAVAEVIDRIYGR